MSIMEMSHRGKEFEGVAKKVRMQYKSGFFFSLTVSLSQIQQQGPHHGTTLLSRQGQVVREGRRALKSSGHPVCTAFSIQ